NHDESTRRRRSTSRTGPRLAARPGAEVRPGPRLRAGHGCSRRRLRDRLPRRDPRPVIRVYALAAVLGLVDEGAYEDIDATSAAVAQDGSLVLTRQEFREVRDPGNLAAPPRQESTLPQLVVII